MKSHRTLFAVLPALLLGACAFDGDGITGGSGDDESLAGRLLTRETLEIGPSSLVGVVASDAEGNELPCVQPTVLGGTAVMRSTESGLLLVEDLDVRLSDVTIRAGVLGDEPIQLTDIHLGLGTQLVVEPEWAEEGLASSGFAAGDLILDWAFLANDGEVYPLAMQKLEDTEFGIDVVLRDDATVAAQVATAVDGQLGSFANRVFLSDFTLAVTGVSGAESE